jgi:hypothetical protein
MYARFFGGRVIPRSGKRESASLRFATRPPRTGIQADRGSEKTWRRINGPKKIKLLLEGVAFEDGEPVQGNRPRQQKLAA